MEEGISYSGKLSREKTFMNSAVLCLSAKVFPAIVESSVDSRRYK